MQIANAKLIERIRASSLDGALLRDGIFQYVVFLNPVRMRPIIRRAEEWMTQTVARRAASFDVVVNGGIFDVPLQELLSAEAGAGPFPANNTSPIGEVVQAGHVVAGKPSDHYYLAEILTRRATKNTPPHWRYEIGEGDPPVAPNTVSGIGGVGPLIVHGLPYGAENAYPKGTRGPRRGDPGARLRPLLTQRSSRMFEDAASRSDISGKVVVAYHAASGATLVGAQQDGAAPGRSLHAVQYALILAGFSDAVFNDGSDSAMFWYKGRQIIAPGRRKDAEMSVAIGFFEVRSPSPPRPKK